ncbi:Protein of unknown function [Paracoccus solventivorans]|uniref:Nucleoside-triphosphatase THEP1 n=1 Tax=Paracoccus solventivorans TaxID=53463 RepID=A0A1M7IFV4_9RHOB|nr:DUF2478 domain-containing protein [Paracoccus solventivorans]SHM39549.1 Protein of unknown function [Paracoccus solventivorans]
MLGYVIHDDTDGSDRMAALARLLAARGLRLGGAVQVNSTGGDCTMDLAVLGTDAAPIRISQALGPGSKGCRLDPDALERAVGLALSALAGADLVLVNKFGKQESLGRGFRELIAESLSRGIPVLTAVAPDYLPAFHDFTGGDATLLNWDDAPDWCLRPRGAAA